MARASALVRVRRRKGILGCEAARRTDDEAFILVHELELREDVCSVACVHGRIHLVLELREVFSREEVSLIINITGRVHLELSTELW